MTDLVTDVKSLELETLKNLKSSKAPNTSESIQSLIIKILRAFVLNTVLKQCQLNLKVLSLYLNSLITNI